MTSSADGADPAVIVIAAAVIVDRAGRWLLVRKRGTTRFMQAGGKIDAGEGAAEALVRELREELELDLVVEQLTYVGRFHAAAANEAHHVVDAEVYLAPLAGEVRAAAEIEEILWMAPSDAHTVALAPLTVDVLLPLLVRTD